LQLPAKICEYSKTVCEQIRWKKAHSIISKELEDHMIDQKSAFVAEGLDEEAAIDKAIEEMGDPVLVGSELDRTYRPKVEWGIVLLAGISLLTGLVLRALVSYGTGMPLTLTNGAVGAVLGIGSMVLAYSLDFTTIGKYPKTIYFGLIALIIGVIAVSPVINGKYFYAQSILLFFPTAFAGIIYSMRTKGYLGIVMSGVLYIFPVLIGLYIPSLSSVILITLACLILLTIGYMLPDIEADFLLTYLIHRFGWIVFAVVMAVILAFIVRAFMLCSRQKSVLGKLVSTSVLITFTIQVILYVSSNLGFQLFSQLTLPLISYGRTAIVINMTLIGIMLSVFKSGDLVRDNLTETLLRKNKLVEITDGKIIINLNTILNALKLLHRV